ncbi:hypothetical protein SESBI_28323, partial [Sesbania bispinosa]
GRKAPPPPFNLSYVRRDRSKRFMFPSRLLLCARRFALSSLSWPHRHNDMDLRKAAAERGRGTRRATEGLCE